MTWAEIQKEKAYRVSERLAIMAGDREPTPAQIEMAKAEARKWEINYRSRFDRGEELV